MSVQAFSTMPSKHEEFFSSIITKNKKMRAIFQYIEAIAGTKEPVLVTGETGVGKELIAKAIHCRKPPRDHTPGP